MMYDISISIVTFNNESTILRTLESIISNMDKSLSFIIYVFDNASKDNTVKIIEDLNNQDIKIIRSPENFGFGKGHNFVLSSVNSKYHIVINPDITIENNIIFEMYKHMESFQDIGLLSPLMKYPDGKIQYLCKRNPTLFDLLIRLVFPKGFKKRQASFTMRDTNYNSFFKIEYASGCFMFFRTSLLKKINGFDESFFLYLEDADITRRINQIANTIFFPNNYVIHDWQRGPHKNLKLLLINIKSVFYYFKKWGIKIF